jgi:hypothetical protein
MTVDKHSRPQEASNVIEATPRRRHPAPKSRLSTLDSSLLDVRAARHIREKTPFSVTCAKTLGMRLDNIDVELATMLDVVALKKDRVDPGNSETPISPPNSPSNDCDCELKRIYLLMDIVTFIWCILCIPPSFRIFLSEKRVWPC